MSGLGASWTTTASRPVRARTRSAVNADTATTASARRRADPHQDPLAGDPVPGKRPGDVEDGHVVDGGHPQSGAPERQVDVEAVDQVARSEAPGTVEGPADPVRLRPHQSGVTPAGSSARADGRTAATRSASTTGTRAASSSRM